jgi:protein phosphatase
VSRHLCAAVALANARIFARADDSRAHRGMGTTIVAAAYDPEGNAFHVAYAGDSRCYRMRDGALHQLTRDHSLVADALLERPDLSETDLAYLPRNVITRALGIGPTVELDVRADPSEPGDLYLLCSDGLHALVPDERIAAILREGQVLTEMCARLIAIANDHGGKDNITAVIVRIEDGDEPWSVRDP